MARAITFTSFLLLILLPVLSAHGDDFTYTLKRGETLYSISRRFKVPLELLLTENKIKDPSRVPVGTEIKIPSMHQVSKGDTLYSIARKYNVSLDDLIESNKINDYTQMRVGALLIIPHSETEYFDKPRDPVTANKVLEQSDTLWPHPGPKEEFKGKLKGVVISGRIGDRIFSISSGSVVWAGPYRGFGRVVFVESPGGYIYVYAGNEKTLVSVGDTVQPGKEIGRLGMNVHAGTPQLLFLVYQHGKPVDPWQAPRG